MEQVHVALYASTPLSRLGLAGYLRSQPAFTLLADSDRAAADVEVLCCDRLIPEFVATMRRSAARGRSALVLVVGEITEGELRLARECRVIDILPRHALTAEGLVRSVTAAAGGERPAPAERMRQEVLNPRAVEAGLNPREIDLLRLMAEGLDTDEIAAELRYSPRTVENVVHGITRRLGLRNRTHAVAYALRASVI